MGYNGTGYAYDIYHVWRETGSSKVNLNVSEGVDKMFLYINFILTLNIGIKVSNFV